MTYLTQHLTVVCPRCDEPQIILASELAPGQVAHCTNCAEPLGRWHELVSAESKVA